MTVASRRIRRISVIAPMLNEAEHVDALVADIAARDWDGEVELLVADGRSTDGSVERLRAAAARHGVALEVVDNPDRWVSQGLNKCIRRATGDLIVRLDCHSRYPADYLRRCVVAAEETGAENVGGVTVPRGRTPMERAVAAAVDSAFGGIGWSRHRTEERVEVDTVPFGAFRPEAFRRAGLFDESLVRNQDDEFNLRLRRAGGKVVLDPSIRVFYTPRGSFRRLFRQYYEYGRWKAPVMRKHHRATSARSLVPAAFVAALLALVPLSLWLPHAAALLTLKVSAYGALALGFGVVCVRRRREPWRLLPRVVAVFPAVHVAHGLGMIAGWFGSLGRAVAATGRGAGVAVSVPARAGPPVRRISVIAPMLNEAGHVQDLVADVAAQDWDGEVELLVADGRSTDGSVELLRAAAARHGVELKVLDNPERWVSFGLNRCIREATGDLIVRIDCHSRYPPDYLRRCALAAEETGAENVGGVFVPTGRTPMERAVAAATDSPFGGVHWTRHGTSERVETDTVPYGAYRPEAFRMAGLFDESLVRNQDDEFNLRLRRAGGRIVLDPSIRVFYTPRGSFRRLFHQYYEYGRWKAPVMRKHGKATSARSLVPGGFVGSLLVLVPLAIWLPAAMWVLDVEVAAYVVGAVAFGVACVRRRREPWRLLPRVVAVFPTVHVAHGLGMLVGWARTVTGARPSVGRPRASSL